MEPNSYRNINEVKQAFKSGKIDFKHMPTLTIANVPFNYRDSSSYSMHDMIVKNVKGIIVYSCVDAKKQAAIGAGLNKWILFIWGFNNSYNCIPYDVRPTTPARASGKIIKESDTKNTESQDSKRILTDTTSVEFPYFSKSITGKIDTGADISSLHATDIHFNRGEGHNFVTFLCPELSDNTITMPIQNMQTVKSADGGQTYRPVVSIDITINDKMLRNVLFNLNDRTNMDEKVLIGKNVIQDGDFILDLNSTSDVSESIEVDWETLQRVINEQEQLEETVSNGNI